MCMWNKTALFFLLIWQGVVLTQVLAWNRCRISLSSIIIIKIYCESVFLENFPYLNFVTEGVILLPSIQTNQNNPKPSALTRLIMPRRLFFGWFFLEQFFLRIKQLPTFQYFAPVPPVWKPFPLRAPWRLRWVPSDCRSTHPRGKWKLPLIVPKKCCFQRWPQKWRLKDNSLHCLRLV